MSNKPKENAPTSANASGYTRLADYMAWDSPTCSFHRFQSLNALNLLGLQAEICALQEDLEFNAQENENQEPKQRQFQCDWKSLESGHPGGTERKRLLVDLRARLNEYSTRLLGFDQQGLSLWS